MEDFISVLARGTTKDRQIALWFAEMLRSIEIAVVGRPKDDGAPRTQVCATDTQLSSNNLSPRVSVFAQMTTPISDLADLGWNAFFDSQLEPEARTTAFPVRVMAVHRDGLNVAGVGVDRMIPPFTATAGDEEASATVGDWLMLDLVTFRPRRLLFGRMTTRGGIRRRDGRSIACPALAGSWTRRACARCG